MTIRAGDLQARLTVTAETLVDRPDGGQDVVRTDVVVNAGAQLEPVDAREDLHLGTQVATATHRAHLRAPYDAEGHVIPITPAMTATARHGYTGAVRTFAIVKVTDVDDRGRELELILEERVT